MPIAEVPFFQLNNRYLKVHKTGPAPGITFGLDHTEEIIDNGFAVYSEVNLREKVGPLKSSFYRVALCLSGSLTVNIGLETFIHQKNTIHFNVPGQLFSMKNPEGDFKCFYLFFTYDFVEEIFPASRLSELYPFFDYLNVPFIQLGDESTIEIKKLFYEIDAEIKRNGIDMARSIKLLLNLIFIAAKRTYYNQNLYVKTAHQTSHLLLRYKKLVGKHFIKHRTVKYYAGALSVTQNHLSKVIKQESGKTPGMFIDEMLIMEIKSLLKYTELNISEIAYQLDFTDTSHLSKFFKKYSGLSPGQYRKNNSFQ